MKSKKCAIALDDLSASTEGSRRCWMAQTYRGRVRGPRWLVTVSACALALLTLYHWTQVQNRGDSQDARTQYSAESESRMDLLTQAAAELRAAGLTRHAGQHEQRHREARPANKHHQDVEDKHADTEDDDDKDGEDDRDKDTEDGKDEDVKDRGKNTNVAEDDKDKDVEDSVDDDNSVSDKKSSRLTQEQIRAVDSAMDDMSETKKDLMHWLFEKYVLPSSPRALQWSDTGDIKDRPGYFRPGNWDWTMTKAGEYDPNLFSPPIGELPKQRFPQAIMIGSGHCGTRALLDFLQMHPNVVVAHSEIHFFDEHFHRGMDWYRGQMPYSFSNQITLEKSPSYVMHPRAPREVYSMNKNVRLLMVVKDPVVAFMSSFSRRMAGRKRYNYSFLTKVNGTMTVNSALYSVARGLFAVHLKKWLQFFPLSQIYVLDGGLLVKDPISQIQAVERFLQVPPKLTSQNFFFNETKGFYCMVPFTMRAPKCLGKNKGLPHVQLDPRVKRLLYDFYRPYNQQLFSMLGKSFDWEPKDTV